MSAPSNYAAVQTKKNQLIRKALNGSAFLAPYSSNAITNLTAATTAVNGTLTANSTINATTVSSSVTVPAGTRITIGTSTGAETVTTTGPSTGSTSPFTVPVPALTKAHASGDTVTSVASVGLAALPTGYVDAGYMTSAGITFAESLTTSETSSWGSVEPTRSDIVKETTTAQIVLQETKALSIGLYTNTDTTGVLPAAGTGEVSVAKPLTPSSIYYRLLGLAVENTSAGEIYVARFLPRVKVTSKGNMPFTMSDDGITWDITFTAFNDSTLGYSERFIFGGAGWSALSADHGFGS